MPLIARVVPLLVLLIGCICLPAGITFAEPVATVGPVNTAKLTGRWLRPDGGYILELRENGKDGELRASYFNPRPIKVGRTELRRKDGLLAVVVELRDVNYPGSTYTLRHEPKLDRLVGTYYQAVEKQTYNVEFVRTK